MSDYDFFGFRRGERQTDGFFVDQDDRILYWPTLAAPGFILPLDVAKRVADGAYFQSGPSRQRDTKWQLLQTFASLVSIALVFLLLLVFVGILAPAIANRYGDALSEVGAAGLLVLAALGLLHAAVFVYRRHTNQRKKKRQVPKLLADGLVQVTSPRPRPRPLRISEVVTGLPATRWARVTTITNIVLSAIVFCPIFLFASLNADLTGDTFAAASFALYIGIIMFRLGLRETVVPGVASLRGLLPKATAPCPQATVPSFGRTLVSLGITLLQFFGIAGALFVAILVALWLQRPPSLQDVNAVDRFDQIAIPKAKSIINTEAEYPPSILYKWRYPPDVTVFVSNPEMAFLREEIEARIPYIFWMAAFESRDAVSAPEDQEPGVIEIRLEEKPNRTPQKTRIAWEWEHKKGALTRVTVWIDFQEYEELFEGASAKGLGYWLAEEALRAGLGQFGAIPPTNEYVYMGGWPLQHWSLRDILLSVQYDNRFTPGMAREDVLLILPAILQEYDEIEDFAGWIKSRPRNP